MELKERLYLNFARIFPRNYRSHMEKLLVYAGEKTNVNSYLGSSLLLSLTMFILVILLQSLFNQFQSKQFIFALIILIITQILYYLLAYFKAESRTKRIEESLPDMLQLISANLKAGMTPFQALKAGARREFGPLKEEIERATAKSLGTESFSDALMHITERIKSEVLERSLKLFTTAMKSGSHLAKLLEELAREISETRSLKKELVTTTKTYTMLIIFTVIVGTPLLMAISIHFLTILTNLQAKTTPGFGLGGFAAEITITPVFLTKIAIAMLIITSLLACILLGVIQDGKIKYGLKYSPIVIGGSFAVFYLTGYLIKGVV